MSLFSICQCVEDAFLVENPDKDCVRCKKEFEGLEWRWHPNQESSVALITGSGRVITFHRRYSNGTAAVRGDKPFQLNHHYYWEVHIYNTLYGTDTMVGVGTPNVVLDSYKFASLLGLDSESWGFSYTGKVQHGGKHRKYSNGFGRGDVVGVHLDMWQGTLSFYLNRKPLGVAFRGLRAHPELYPMVCSTAAQISIGLVVASSAPSSLLAHCCRMLAKDTHTLEHLALVPGLRPLFEHSFWMLLPFINSPEYDLDEYVFAVRGTGLFRPFPGYNQTFNKPDTRGQINWTSSGDDSNECSQMMDRAVTKNTAWGEFTNTNSPLTVTPLPPEDDATMMYSNLNNKSDDEDDDFFSYDIFPESQKKSDIPAQNSVKFVTNFNSSLCEVCRIAPAVIIKTISKKCLQCFYKS